MEDDEKREVETFTGEEIVPGESTGYEVESKPQRLYSPGDRIEFKSYEAPGEVIEAAGKVREKADELNDVLDVYNRALEEDWDETPIEVEGFIRHYYGEGDQPEEIEDPLYYLSEVGSEMATDLHRTRDRLSNGRSDADITSRGRRKIDVEIMNATFAIEDVKNAGAGTEGGLLPPGPKEVKESQSLGTKYWNKVEEESEETNWAFGNVKW